MSTTGIQNGNHVASSVSPDLSPLKEGNVVKNHQPLVHKNITNKMSTAFISDLKRQAQHMSKKVSVNPKPTFEPKLTMDQAMEALQKFETLGDGQVQNGSGIKTSGFLERLKNAFCKFLGFFNKAYKERRTKELNGKLGKVLENIKNTVTGKTENGERFYKNVLLPVMQDDGVNDELKITCFDLFKGNPTFQEKLYGDLLKPRSAGAVLGYCKNRIERDQSFINEIDETALAELYKLFNDNPDIQERLFKSLKEPSPEIRENFWIRHKVEIQSGEIFGFGAENPYGTDAGELKMFFLKSKGNPLSALFLKTAEMHPELDKGALVTKDTWALMQSDDDKRRYLKVAYNLTKEQYIDALETQRREPLSEAELITNHASDVKTVLSFLKSPHSRIPKLSNRSYVINDNTRNMHYRFSFGDVKIDMPPGSKNFWKALKDQIYGQSNTCPLNDKQLENLVNFIYHVPSQGWAASQITGGYTVFTYPDRIDAEFDTTGKIVVSLRNERFLKNYGVHSKLGLNAKSDQSDVPQLKMNGTIQLTYEKSVTDTKSAYEYKIDIKDYNGMTVEFPEATGESPVYQDL